MNEGMDNGSSAGAPDLCGTDNVIMECARLLGKYITCGDCPVLDCWTKDKPCKIALAEWMKEQIRENKSDDK